MSAAAERVELARADAEWLRQLALKANFPTTIDRLNEIADRLTFPAEPTSEMREALEVSTHLLERYRTETPLGNQPHMIAHSAEVAVNVGNALLAQTEKGRPMSERVGRSVKRHASGDPFLRNAANDVLKRHANFPRVKWEEALTAISEVLGAAALSDEPTSEMIAAGRVAYFHFRQGIESDVLFSDLTSEEQEDFVSKVYLAMTKGGGNVG